MNSGEEFGCVILRVMSVSLALLLMMVTGPLWLKAEQNSNPNTVTPRISKVVVIFFRTVSSSNTLKIPTPFVHAGLFRRFHCPPNFDMDYRICSVRLV